MRIDERDRAFYRFFRPRIAVGPAALARAESGLSSGFDRVEENDVFRLRRSRRTGRAAVDARRANGVDTHLHALSTHAAKQPRFALCTCRYAAFFSAKRRSISASSSEPSTTSASIIIPVASKARTESTRERSTDGTRPTSSYRCRAFSLTNIACDERYGVAAL